MEEELAKAGEQEQEQDLESLWELWKYTLLTAAKQVYGTFRPRGIKKATHWWTSEIGNMIKEKKNSGNTSQQELWRLLKNAEGKRIL
jgi:hypothetical protein